MTVATLEAFEACLFGLLFGSFANVCIHRMPIEESVATRRSHCPHCDALIRWFDNIPVVSYVVLGGRCRSCRASIAIQYPLIEISCGALWGYARTRFDGADFVGAAALLWACLVVFMTDVRYRIIPDEISIGFSLMGLLASPFLSLATHADSAISLLHRVGFESAAATALGGSLVGLIVGGGAILAVRVLGQAIYRQEAMGMGDVKLMAAVGAWLGVTGVAAALFLGVLVGGALATFLLVTGRAGRRSYVPFGPALVIGSAIALFETRRVMEFFFPTFVS